MDMVWASQQITGVWCRYPGMVQMCSGVQIPQVSYTCAQVWCRYPGTVQMCSGVQILRYGTPVQVYR